MVDVDNLKLLEAYYPYEISAECEDEIIIHDGNLSVRVPYEMTLSPDYPDSHCCRCMYRGEYYYFG